jgi:hypothetical protein
MHHANQTFDAFDYRSLLFTNRQATVFDDPFFHGCIDNYLPTEIYQALFKAFPKEQLKINYTAKASLDHDDATLKSFGSTAPICKSLLDVFTSRVFLDDLKDFMMPALIRDRGNIGEGDWYYVSDWSKARRLTSGIPIKVTFKFSQLTLGKWIPPHTDKPAKLLSILIYFPEPDWYEDYGGGTEIYEPKYALLKNNWWNFEMPFEFMHYRRTFAFKPNRLVVFPKAKNSWHGVSPLHCPADRSRKSLLITLHNGVSRETSTHKIVRNAVRAWMRLKGYSPRSRRPHIV